MKTILKSVTQYESCRLCSSDRVEVILDLGSTPLANAYQKRGTPQTKYPLVVHQCQDCGSTELKYGVDPEVLYGNYIYESSTSGSLAAYFKEYASHVTRKLGLKPGAKILEIGSNDGVLLRPLVELGYTCLGVEPARNLCEKSVLAGLDVVPDFFDQKLARRLLKERGSFDAVFINNALAHSNYTREIVEGAAELLSEQGSFVFENAYWLRNVQKRYFGQIYHEHWHYFSIKPLVKLFQSCGMTFYDVEERDFQDGSIRGYAGKGSRVIADSISRLTQEEMAFGLYNRSTYEDFRKVIENLRARLVSMLKQFKADGKTVCVYGCPAKLTTMLEYFGIGQWIDYVVEDSQVKQGLATPSGDLPIYGSDYFRAHPTDYALIGATNYSKMIRDRNPQYQGTWIEMIPE